MKLCSVSILYYPEEVFFKHLSTYSKHVEKVVIVDNTPGINVPELLYKLENVVGKEKLQYISNGVNLGVAASLNKAFEWAYNQGYTWMLTMDQDSYFADGNFFSLSQSYIKEAACAIVAASYAGKLPFRKNYSPDFDQVLFTITSGNIVGIEAWHNCGGFNEKLFIDEVDNDFCLRLKKMGYKLITSKVVFLQHGLGLSFSIKPLFFKKPLQIGIHKPQRMYFTVRNGLYVMTRYFFISPVFFFNRAKHLSIKLLLIIFFYPSRLQYLRFYCSGIKDFILSKYENIPGAGK